MKLTLIAVASTVFTLSLSAHAEDMPGMKMDGMEGMQMKQETTQAPVATADGTIKAIDTVKHTVTISHGAVPAVQWPPMTMAFAAAEDQLKGLTTGDRVSFSFRIEGGRATIVSISK
ncbi:MULTISPECIES: copper-binding protein [Pseudomonas]|jgi:Cu(I)/Ag(I) efflux system periplasmic protein CusF|uniref:Copper-binding protein n=1 Tax=Pseudomonas reactans TaxID=117680 RepID=A0ABX2R7F3_9PSED|nr:MULTISPECIES: copper-binding protein [Pseudomonas]MCK8654743.1 copper-binding protein [Pseudomonas umsongensis]NWA45902.1 copper-binding protein [Pseudomonas reactans]NWD98626.1 copper-binding protein [Pseudomonas reactans]